MKEEDRDETEEGGQGSIGSVCKDSEIGITQGRESTANGFERSSVQESLMQKNVTGMIRLKGEDRKPRKQTSQGQSVGER